MQERQKILVGNEMGTSRRLFTRCARSKLIDSAMLIEIEANAEI